MHGIWCLERLISNNIGLDSPYWLQELAGNTCIFLNRHFGDAEYRKFRKFLALSQWFTRRQLEQYQTEKLKQLLDHAFKNVPYYRDIFIKNNLTPDNFNSIKDLRKLPFLTKEDVVKNPDRLISGEVDRKYLLSGRTSGTTGVPMEFFSDMRYAYRDYAFFQRHHAYLGITGYKRKIRITGVVPENVFIPQSEQPDAIFTPQNKYLQLTGLREGLFHWEKKLELIRKFKPACIRGAPSVLYDFAGYLQEHNINDITSRVITATSENLFPYQRELIGRQFGCKVYDQYNCTEQAISAAECLRQNGMHLDMERGITEIIDNNGELLPDGKIGRIMATPLHNYAMPLIRYVTGDISAISETSCPCGRGLPLLESFDGRIKVFRYKNKFFGAHELSPIIGELKNIKECQFVQEKETEVVINIVKRDGFSENDEKKLIKYVHDLIDEKIEIKLNFVASIPRTKMGKFQLVVSKLR
ncbi:MAG: hypothetical protein ABIG11_00450 [bacterium]